MAYLLKLEEIHMIYKPYKDGIQLSALGLGCMRLPTVEDVPNSPIDRARASEIIDYAISHGINYFDTAYLYHGGDSEKFLGEVLTNYARDSYYIADKYPLMGGPDYRAIFEEQLTRLRTDYIDFYLLHGITDLKADEYLTCGCIEYFMEQKAKGRIKYLGFSSHANPDALQKVVGHHNWDMAQIQLNYFDWAYGTAKTQYEILTEAHIPVMVMEPIRGGRLLSALKADSVTMLENAQPGKSLASWALRWLMRLPGVQVVLSGMSTLDQIKENVATFNEYEPLTDEHAGLLMKAAEEYRNSIAIPCTGCRYCCDGCPQELNIPDMINIYNSFKINGPFGLGGLDVLPAGKGPADCIGCGVCADNCPQGITIPDLMKELAGASQHRI